MPDTLPLPDADAATAAPEPTGENPPAPEPPAVPAAGPPPAVPAAGPPPAVPAPDRLRRIFASAARVRERRSVYEDAAARAKGAKKALEAEQEEHEALVAELEREAAAEHESLPLFPDDTAAPEPPADPDGWRSELLADLGLPPAIVEKLTEAELTTVGQLADWTDGGKELTDIPGIGPAKAEKIEEATEDFWARRNSSAVRDSIACTLAPLPDAPPADAEDDPVGDSPGKPPGVPQDATAGRG